MQSSDWGLITLASAQEVRNAIVKAEEEHLIAKQRFEKLQSDFYSAFTNLLTAEEFFSPLLTSASKEIVGRFSLRSRISVHACFISPGKYTDTVGYFQIKFLSMGNSNVTQEFDTNFCEKAIHQLSPYVQNCVQKCFETYGWKVWWTPTHFCFQDANEYRLVQDALILGSLYRSIQPLDDTTEKVQSSCLTRLDLSNVLNNN